MISLRGDHDRTHAKAVAPFGPTNCDRLSDNCGFQEMRGVVFSVALATCIFGALSGCAAPKRYDQAFALKAAKKIAECKALGDKPIFPRGRFILWDLDRKSTHRASALLDQTVKYAEYSGGDGPVTVFLVETHQERVGNYSKSNAAAYQQRLSVYVVQFRSLKDDGTAIADSEVLSLDPAAMREAKPEPEYGDPDPRLASWVGSWFSLIDSADQGKIERVKAIIAAGVDVNAKDQWGVCPLGAAAVSGHADCVKALVAAGANVNAKGNSDITALLAAALGGNSDCVKELIAAGADVNATDNKGLTVLMAVAMSPYDGVTGVDPKLVSATNDRHADCLKALIAAGADVNASTNDGKTALKEASGNPKLEAILKAAGAKP
jgi:hypothetical protein